MYVNSLAYARVKGGIYGHSDGGENGDEEEG